MSLRLTLDQCGTRRLLHAVPEGRYDVEYHDSTHVKEDDWVGLGNVEVRETRLQMAADDGVEQFYTVTCAPGPPPSAGEDKSGRWVRAIQDTLALALGRVGLLSPEVTPELLADILDLNEEEGVLVVPDTNALHNGSVHWLLSVLRRPSVWLLPVVASLTTVQVRDALVKGFVNQRKPSNLVQALRSRGLVNGALGLLQRNRGRYQVMEIDAALLRYQKPASNSGMDPDQGDVLEDRLIIEAIHAVLRSMRTRSATRVVTSDVNIARVLEAEGIKTLFVPTIAMPSSPVACLRFDALSRSFVGAPLRATLWELAHAFGTLRLVRRGIEEVRLDCHWPGKTPSHWNSETLTCSFKLTPSSGSPEGAGGLLPLHAPAQAGGADTLSPVAVRPSHAGPVSGEPPDFDQALMTGADVTPMTAGEKEVDARREPAATQDAINLVRSAQAGDDPSAVGETTSANLTGRPPREGKVRGGARTPVAREREINVALPRASLPQMLHLLEAARRVGPASAAAIVSASPGDPITVDNARRALEILKRVGLLAQRNDAYDVTPGVKVVDASLRGSDLDAIHSIMMRFEPYQAFLAVLQARGSVPRGEVTEAVRSAVGKVGNYESERLPRFHVLLGQAWTRGDSFVDGSQRPTARDASDAFDQAFDASSSDGIAGVADLLERFCAATRMSPWAAKRRMEEFAREDTLPGYAFQTAAGRRPVTRDSVLGGGLDGLRVDPVVVDRLQLGNRPVFTVERRPR